MASLTSFLSKRAKAIAALAAPWVVAAVARYGFHVDVNVAEALITSLLSGVAVHQTTNA